MTLFIAIISIVNIALGYGLAVYLRTDQIAPLPVNRLPGNVEQNASPQPVVSDPEPDNPQSQVDDLLAHPDEVDAEMESMLAPHTDAAPEPEKAVQPSKAVHEDPMPAEDPVSEEDLSPEVAAETLLAEPTEDEPAPAVAELLPDADGANASETEPITAELPLTEPDDVESSNTEVTQQATEPVAELMTEQAEEPTVAEQPDMPLDEEALEGLEAFRQQLAEQTEQLTTPAAASEEADPEPSSGEEQEKQSESEILAGIEAFRSQLAEAQG